MAWTLFAALTSPKEPDLDTNLATLANLGVIPCAVTGTNTLALSPLAGDLPPIQSYANNQLFVGRLGAGNTAAVTAQYLNLAQLNVYKDTAAGPAALSGAEMAQNQMALFAYDSTLNGGLGGLHLLNPLGTAGSGGGAGPPGPPGPAGASSGAPGYTSNLKIVWASNTTATITAKAIGVSDGVSTFFTMFNPSLTLNAATVGANGLSTDITGAALGNSSWYYVYAIYAPGTATAACLLSSSATAPVLPTGYTLSARLGALRTDGSAHLIGTIQVGNKTQYVVGSNLTALPVMANGVTGTYSGSAPTYAAIAVANFVPPTAAEIMVIGMRNYNNGTAGAVQIAPNNSYGGYFTNPANPAPLDDGNAEPGNLPLTMVLESANIYWAGSAAGSGVACRGWVDAL